MEENKNQEEVKEECVLQKGEEEGAPEKKISVGRRIGFFFLSMTPCAAFFVLQVVISLVYVLVTVAVTVAGYQGGSPEQLMNVYLEAISKATSGILLACHLAGILVYGLWYYFGCRRPKLKQSVKNMSVKAVAVAVLGGVAMCFVANSMVGIEQYLFPKAMENYIEMAKMAGLGVSLLANIAAVVLAPIGEELLCRGITLYYAKKALPHFWMANILQAVLFGILHANLIQGLYAFVIGLILGYLAERYQSLLPCILLHFVVNFSSTVWVDKVFSGFPDVLPAYIILFAVSIAAALLVVFWGGPIKAAKEKTA